MKFSFEIMKLSVSFDMNLFQKLDPIRRIAFIINTYLSEEKRIDSKSASLE